MKFYQITQTRPHGFYIMKHSLKAMTFVRDISKLEFYQIMNYSCIEYITSYSIDQAIETQFYS